ncbi:MAG: methylenetetrahydrofolate reductase [NAD(P)H] [Clostridia bacterium]|nr:methylenetetrahydrofolate reductase [NAD(P)H] [Clostridia bacterium]
MYIKDIFSSKKPVLSFEVFPPKQENNIDTVTNAIVQMSKLPIDYMSVTYGAGGSTSKKTAEIASYMENTLNLTALAHLTCVSLTREQVKETLSDLQEKGIKNILALRGDTPQDKSLLKTDYKYASELVREIKDFGGFCVGGACYPECHPDSSSLDADIENLKVKVDEGCDFLVTQMFFDNDAFYRFRDKAAKKGIDKPFTAGIMPLTNIGQIQRMCILSGGASMPSKFTRMISKFENNPEALKQAGIAYAVDQIIDLLSNDTDGIHLYTMNRPGVAEKIVSVINNLF